MKKGFFGYGRCPNCDAFLKEKDLENNTCWSCNNTLEKKKKIKTSVTLELLEGVKSGELLFGDWVELDCVSCSLWVPWRELDLDTGYCTKCIGGGLTFLK